MNDTLFQAGAARADITPPVGTLLYGYVPDSVSTSVHDPLGTAAAVFSQNGIMAVLITVTVGDFGTDLCREARERIGKALGIPAGRVIIAATHTHSAPNVSGFEGWGEIDRPYVENILFPGMEKAAREAAGSLAPAELSVGVTESLVGINRREQRRDGSIDFGQNPWGCFDPAMTCVRIRNAETKKGILNILHYGCHGTAAGNNREISRDWSGVMTDRLEAVTGTPTAFFNGAQGDVGPRLTNGQTTGDIRYVEELGGAAAQDALRAYRACGPWFPGRLSLYEGEIRLPRRPLPSKEETEAFLAREKDPDSLVNLQRLRWAYYRAVMDEYEAGCPAWEEHMVIPQTILDIGGIAFVPFPFEIFSEITLRLSAYAPFRHTLSLSNANGYEAYLPTESALCRGGYEVDCFRYSGPHPLTDDADQRIIEENLRIIEENGRV